MDDVDVQADVTMHLGRSGEAYFVGEDELEGWQACRHLCAGLYKIVANVNASLDLCAFDFACEAFVSSCTLHSLFVSISASI